MGLRLLWTMRAADEFIEAAKRVFPGSYEIDADGQPAQAIHLAFEETTSDPRGDCGSPRD